MATLFHFVCVFVWSWVRDCGTTVQFWAWKWSWWPGIRYMYSRDIICRQTSLKGTVHSKWKWFYLFTSVDFISSWKLSIQTKFLSFFSIHLKWMVTTDFKCDFLNFQSIPQTKVLNDFRTLDLYYTSTSVKLLWCFVLFFFILTGPDPHLLSWVCKRHLIFSNIISFTGTIGWEQNWIKLDDDTSENRICFIIN